MQRAVQGPLGRERVLERGWVQGKARASGQEWMPREHRSSEDLARWTPSLAASCLQCEEVPKEPRLPKEVHSLPHEARKEEERRNLQTLHPISIPSCSLQPSTQDCQT